MRSREAAGVGLRIGWINSLVRRVVGFGGAAIQRVCFLRVGHVDSRGAGRGRLRREPRRSGCVLAARAHIPVRPRYRGTSMSRCQVTPAASRLRGRWGRGCVPGGVRDRLLRLQEPGLPATAGRQVASKLCSYNREASGATCGNPTPANAPAAPDRSRDPSTREGRRTPGIQGKRHMDVPRPRVHTRTCARAVPWIPGVRRPPPKPALPTSPLAATYRSTRTRAVS